MAIGCTGCGQPMVTTMGCPTCQKLGLVPALFCSQECFKASWAEHKKVHKAAKKLAKESESGGGAVTCTAADGNTTGNATGNNSNVQLKDGQSVASSVDGWKENPCMDRSNFIGFEFTGSLRPFPFAKKQRACPSADVPDLPDYAQSGTPQMERMQNRLGLIPVVDRDSQDFIDLKASCQLSRAALDGAAALVKPGNTPEMIDDFIHTFFVKQNNTYPSPLNYRNFPRSVCVSVNEVICHGIPDSRPFEIGDIVNIDVTGFHRGFHADLNETYAVVPDGGDVTKACDGDTIRLLNGAKACLDEAMKACKPGVMYRDLGNIITATARNYGLSVVRTYCGHGVGKLFHCNPNIPHYEKNKAVGVMKKGHVFTIEPMINLGGYQDLHWPDGWTAVTADGKRSAQFEHTMIVTDDGVEVLTARVPGQSVPFQWDEVDVPVEGA